MAWRMTSRPQTVLATKVLSNRFATMDCLSRDREVKERRLLIYDRLFAQGLFRPCTWACCYCKETGSEIRVNGHHTSILLSRMSQIPEYYVIVESYEADTLEDVVALWTTFDTKTGVRTPNEIYQAAASIIPELSSAPRTLIRLGVAGMAYGEWQEDARKKTSPERAELLFDHTDFINWLHDPLQVGTNIADHLNRGPVIGAMFTTYRKSRKDATAFWLSVRDETGESPQSPDRMLAKFLGRVRVAANSRMAEYRAVPRTAPSREFYVKSLNAWNAWRKKLRVDHLKYHPTANVPSIV